MVVLLNLIFRHIKDRIYEPVCQILIISQRSKLCGAIRTKADIQRVELYIRLLFQLAHFHIGERLVAQLAGIPIRRVYAIHIHQVCADIVLRSTDADTPDDSRIYGWAGIGQYLSGMLLQRLPVLNGTGRELKFVLLRLTRRAFL